MRIQPAALALIVILATSSAAYAEDKWADLNPEVIRLYQKKDYPRAVRKAQTALDAAENEYGAGSREVILSENNLAMLYKTTGKYAAAERLYKKSLADSEKLLGPEHPDLALPLNNLALYYQSQGKRQTADKYADRAVAILEKAYGPNHANVVEAKARYALMKKQR